MQCLGAQITDAGIVADPAKVDKIQAWKTPRDSADGGSKDLRRFLGLVNFISDHLPDLASIAAPLADLTGKKSWKWSEETDAQAAFKHIKVLIPQVLTPINWSLVESGEEEVFIFTDASLVGTGYWLGQGKTWQTARPARFGGHKFTSAQLNYFTTEQEMLAVVDGVLAFQNCVTGYPFTLCTDHASLRHFFTQPTLTAKQIRWAQLLSRHDFRVIYIPGKANIFADALSRWHEADCPNEVFHSSAYVNLPEHFDSSMADEISHGADLGCISARFASDHFDVVAPSGNSSGVGCPTSRPLAPVSRARKGLALSSTASGAGGVPDSDPAPAHQRLSTTPLLPDIPLANEFSLPCTLDDTLSSNDSCARQRELLGSALGSAFAADLVAGYSNDNLFSRIRADPHHHANFVFAHDGLLYVQLKESPGGQVGYRVCVPSGRAPSIQRGATTPSMREAILELCHRTLGHRGPRPTLAYVRHFYWWPSMVTDVDAYCRTCDSCARLKPDKRPPAGLLHPHPLPSRPWETVGIDFIGPMVDSIPEPGAVPANSIMTISDHFGPGVVLIACCTTDTAEDVNARFFRYFVARYGVPSRIVCDRDRRFVSTWWKELCARLHIDIAMTTSFHPEGDGKAERTNQTVVQVLKAFVEYSHDQWASQLPLAEYALMAAPSSASGVSGFEVNFGFVPPLLPSQWATIDGPPAAANRIEEARRIWTICTDAMIASRVRMVAQANKHRRDDLHGDDLDRSPDFQVGKKAYLSTKDLKMPMNLSRKFLPKFIGPFDIVEVQPASSNVVLDLPHWLPIHAKFHTSKLRPHWPNDDERFPGRQLAKPAPIDIDGDDHYEVERILTHRWYNRKRQFFVRWVGYGADDDWWQDEADMGGAHELVQAYLVLHPGASHPPCKQRGAAAPWARRKPDASPAFAVPASRIEPHSVQHALTPSFSVPLVPLIPSLTSHNFSMEHKHMLTNSSPDAP
jgi:hypothetical protein